MIVKVFYRGQDRRRKIVRCDIREILQTDLPGEVRCYRIMDVLLTRLCSENEFLMVEIVDE